MLNQQQKEEVIDAINTLLIMDTIRVNEYLEDLDVVNGYINYGDAYYVNWWKPSIDCCLDDIILEVCPCGGYRNSGYVSKSNYKVFVDKFGEFDGVYESSGGMGTYAVFIRPELLLNKEIYETLCALTDYPVLNDMVHSEMEEETKEESWDNWVREDFESSLEGKLNLENLDYEDEDLRKVFETGRRRANEYWYEESSGMHINVEAIASVITLEDLTQNNIEFELMEE
jgi:hypothetical protein